MHLRAETILIIVFIMSFSSAWLALSSCNSELVVEEFEEAFHSLKWPVERKPGVVALCGYASKPKYLKALLGRSIHRTGHGQVRLLQDNKPRTRLVVDFELFKEFSTRRQTRLQAKSRRLHPSLQRTSRQHVAAALLSHVINPFADVTCYLAADLGGLPGIALLLADHVRAIDGQHYSHVTPSHIVVVLESHYADELPCRREKDNANLRRQLIDILRAGDHRNQNNCSRLMDNLSIFYVPARALTVPKALCDHIIEQQDRIHHLRDEQGFKFQHNHLACLLKESLESFCYCKPFCLLRAAYPARDSLEEKQRRLRSSMPELLRLIELQRADPGPHVLSLYGDERIGTISLVIAASIILISCPPGAHLFQLAWLYEQLFQCSVREGLSDGGWHPTLEVDLQTTVKHHLEHWFQKMRSKRTINGGGIKGIVPLTYLAELEKQLARYKSSLRDHFDLVCGTSAGGLIALGIFVMDWDVSHCIKMFKNLAREMFTKRVFGYSPLATVIASAIRLILAIRRDHMYDPQPIEQAFRGDKNDDIQLNLLSTGTRVAVATTIAAEKPHPYLFTNYTVPQENVNDWDRKCGNVGSENSADGAVEANYGRLAPHNSRGNLTIAQAARATAAAPWLFPPVRVAGAGLFQDGGLHFNNPAQLADWETQALWPEHKARDFELSLGTGFSQGILRSQPKFLRRLLDSMLHNMDGQKIHKEYIRNRSIRDKERTERFNFDYGFPEPALDDCTRMEWLESETYRHIDLTDSIARARDAAISSLFYFELDRLPEFCPGSNSKSFWQCSGYIACRNQPCQEGYEALVKDLERSFFLITEFCSSEHNDEGPSAAPLGQPEHCLTNASTVGIYRKPLTFSVRSLDNKVAITLNGITSQPKSISGFPTSVNQLSKRQQLQAPFGRPDHSIGKPLPARPAIGRKRKMSSAERESLQPAKLARFL
ncbi:hypothetical protein CBER1_10984 [Cercospora berteroae]|uniref:PNPLA domain-containing protein n=1 Tax=Cercospora berteroae TaxID=357750 RepID=A0A2S6BXF0_9PEZI|nr:hypothetical protein CBER1_10984 [Cercospora berteroae]